MATKTLFNDATLSDVKIIQIHQGKTREYHAHKVALCLQSSYFMKAFTGNFKEASEAVITLKDDDPVHFEFALKFMYTEVFDMGAIEATIGKDDKLKRIHFAMGVYTIADKYNIKRLVQPAYADLQRNLDTTTDIKTMEALVEAHYTKSSSGHRFGTMIVSTLFGSHHVFTRSAEFGRLCTSYPPFASDVMASMQRFTCRRCRRTVFFGGVVHDIDETQVRCGVCHGWAET